MFGIFNKKSASATSAPKADSSSSVIYGGSTKPNTLDTCITLKNNGDILLAQGAFKRAAQYYLQAISCNPDFAEAYNNLGNACSEQGLFKDAEHYLNKALKLKPELCNVYYNLAMLHLDQDRVTEAIENFAKTLKCNPIFYAAQALLFNQYQKICRWDDYYSHVKILRDAASVPSQVSTSIFSPFIFLATPGTTPEEQKQCAEKWIKSEFDVSEKLCDTFEYKINCAAGQKISIAYISADFHQHAVSLQIAEVIELHDRKRFNIVAYSYGPDDNSTMRRRLESSFDNFVDIKNISNEDAARKIYADHIDILVDLTGHTQNSRSAILAFRPAPIQVNFLGYPGTMGADFIDYLIADKFVIPTEARKQYAEKVLWMPDCFMPHDRTRPRLPAPNRKICGLPEDGFVFCCFNQTYKITPEVFDIWCRLLSAVPGSLLWLSESNEQAACNLRREAENRGVSSERIIMAAKLPQLEAHLARLQCADLFLDTIPYNAHSTCSDALWMGLPVLTCVDNTFPSRVAGSMLTTIGVPELITFSQEGYYKLAVELSSNLERLAAIRSRIITHRDTSLLFDSERYTRNLENLYVKMIDDYPKHNLTSLPSQYF